MEFHSARRTPQLRPVREERGRWLSAVLIVAAIGATTVAVRVWPARFAPAAVGPPAALSARWLPLLDSPLSPRSGAVSARAAVPIAVGHVHVARGSAGEPLTLTVAPPPAPSPAEAGPVPVPPAGIATAAAETRELATLPSRRIHLPGTPPAMAAIAALPPVTEPPGPSYALAELPAVAVSRAMAVAGRGIKTGLRATSAVFRAAF